MAQKRTQNQSKLIIQSALALADKSGWRGLTLEAVAKKAKMKTSEVEKSYPHIWRILAAAVIDLDLATAAQAKGLSDTSWRDSLFEIIMTRLEIANDHKSAYIDALKQPQAMPHLAKPFFDSAVDMLKLAKAPATLLHAAIFGAVYLAVVDAWKNDDSADMSKTMAVMDKRLGWFEKVAGYVPCSSGRRN
jgi:hypothetical protein